MKLPKSKAQQRAKWKGIKEEITRNRQTDQCHHDNPKSNKGALRMARPPARTVLSKGTTPFGCSSSELRAGGAIWAFVK